MSERIAQFLLARLREPSTWRGIILLFTALGVAIKPEVAEAIVVLGLALAGGVGAVTPDRPDRLQPLPPAADDSEEPDDTGAWSDIHRIRGED